MAYPWHPQFDLVSHGIGPPCAVCTVVAEAMSQAEPRFPTLTLASPDPTCMQATISQFSTTVNFVVVTLIAYELQMVRSGDAMGRWDVDAMGRLF